MSCLKLPMASICTNPYKWVRTITTTTTTTTKPTVSLSSSRRSRSRQLTFSLLSLDVNWRTLRACASLTPPAHVSCRLLCNNITNDCRCASPEVLGFRFRGRNRVCFSSSSSSSAEKGGSGPAADMGQENGVTADQNCCCSPEDHQNQSPSPSPSVPPQQQQQQSSKLLTLPTVLTLGRVAAVPLLVATFYIDSWWGRTSTTSIFIAAAITDWLDGYIARKMRLGSAFGAFLDPVADKIMVAATLILLCTRPTEVAMFGEVSWLLTVPSIAIIGREITMSALREWAASQNSKLLEAVAVNNLGKWKTATQMMALTILLATRDSSVGGLVASGVVLLYISAGLSVWSLAVYMGKIWKVLLK